MVETAAALTCSGWRQAIQANALSMSADSNPLIALARLPTPFRQAVQTNLHSVNAAGKPMFARYNIAGLGDEAKATAFGSLAQSCCPTA